MVRYFLTASYLLLSSVSMSTQSWFLSAPPRARFDPFKVCSLSYPAALSEKLALQCMRLNWMVNMQGITLLYSVQVQCVHCTNW